MLLVAARDKSTARRLAEELAAVETLFATELASDLPCVRQLVEHVEQYRGKRLRPMLVLVAGLATAPDTVASSEAHRTLAAVVEMVHMATLVHDDVLDDAQVRRGGATVNFLRGNETAVMLGDYLISHAYHLCSRLGGAHLSQLVAQTTNVVCEGELLQLANRENWQLDETTYFDIIRRKTASLCGACCRLAGMLHDAPEPQLAALETYGEKLGLAFQIVDDLLDLTGNEQTVGKTVGRDLQKGKLTLPLIHALRQPAAATGQPLRELINQFTAAPADSPEQTQLAQRIRQGVLACGSVDYAHQAARQLVDDARQALTTLPASPARDLLAQAAEAVLTRKF